MAGELGAIPYGLPISLYMQASDPAANTTTNLIAPMTGTGYVVPTGYVFHPMVLMVTADTPVTAGTATFNVTDNAVATPNGPTVLLSSVAPTQRASGVQRLAASPIVAGHVVGVNIVANAGYLPTTDDFDVVLTGVLIAA